MHGHAARWALWLLGILKLPGIPLVGAVWALEQRFVVAHDRIAPNACAIAVNIDSGTHHCHVSRSKIAPGTLPRWHSRSSCERLHRPKFAAIPMVVKPFRMTSPLQKL
jgi:hypothetical protein